jgi:hypothetical protein
MRAWSRSYTESKRGDKESSPPLLADSPFKLPLENSAKEEVFQKTGLTADDVAERRLSHKAIEKVCLIDVPKQNEIPPRFPVGGDWRIVAARRAKID